MLQFVFWAGVAALVYVYVGYPMLARLWAAVAPLRVRKGEALPSITVVVAAYNEELGIEAKLANIAALDYPADRIDVIVASDASSDRTDEIVRSYADRRVRLLRVEGRRGKTACQNAAAEQASGEIVVFTDATTEIEPAALRKMAANFADPAVGCVAGSLVYVGKGRNLTAHGGTAYWGYEISLRKAESDLGSLVGVSGCLYAVRQSAYRPIDPQLISDFVVAFKMREQGLRTVLEPEAVCFEETLDRGSAELSMRVRVAIRSLNALVHEGRMLNPLKFGRFAWQLWSHKALRYASPLLWMLILACNVALLGQHPIYTLALAGQLGLLLAGAVGWAAHGAGPVPAILAKPFYFLLTNVASLLALLRYLRGERAVTWTPVRQ